METVQVAIRTDVFADLKRLAEPLVDDASAVIDRLIKHWEATAPEPGMRLVSIKVPSTPTEWRSARGERFPIGAKLRAAYFDHGFTAKVTQDGIEFNGKTFDNPSSAGIAAKQSVGKTGKTASTNGWTFWEIQDPTTGRWRSIDSLRMKNGA